MAVRDLTGALRAWIEVGWPDAARLHKAAKASPRVAVYPHKDAGQWLKRLEGERIHRAADIQVRAIDVGLIAAMAARLDRRMAFAPRRLGRRAVRVARRPTRSPDSSGHSPSP